MKKSGRKIAAIVGALLAGLLLYNAGRTIDWTRTLEIVTSLSLPNLFVILLPYGVLATIDSIAWRRLLPTDWRKASLWKIFKIRASGEAFVMTFPMGAVLSEPMKLLLFKRVLGLRAGLSSASVILRSFVMGMGQATFVIVLTLYSFSFLTWVSQRIIGRSSLEYLLLIGGSFSLLFYGSVTIATTYGSIVSKLQRWLSASRVRLLRSISVKTERYFKELSAQFSQLGAVAGKRGARSKNLLVVYFLYVAVWMTEAFETYLILHLLGAQISWEQAFVVEGICSYLRATAFILPAGLGLEETLYLTMLTSSGVEVALAAGFVVIKRARELLWVLLGYSLMLGTGLKIRRVYQEPEVAGEAR